MSMGFSRQEYWSGLPFPSPEDLPDPGIKLWSPALHADSLPFELQGSPCESYASTEINSFLASQMGQLYVIDSIQFFRGSQQDFPHLCIIVRYLLIHTLLASSLCYFMFPLLNSCVLGNLSK